VSVSGVLFSVGVCVCDLLICILTDSLCTTDAQVPYASSMELAVVKRGTDVVKAVFDFMLKKV